jgi:hypothetical protein
MEDKNFVQNCNNIDLHERLTISGRSLYTKLIPKK